MRPILALLLGLTLCAPARAQKSDDTIRVTWRDALANLDPYRNQLRTGLIVAFHVWDCLVYRDPDTLQIKPALAESWKQVDDRTIDFTLRAGVLFHDGSTLTADDVVYTVRGVLAEGGLAVPSNYGFLSGAEALDDRHVRLHLSRVFPAALEYIAMVLPILPRAYRERVGAEAFGMAPVGTGPYRVERLDGANEIDLERFDKYFDGSPKGRPAIHAIRIREVADASAELADLLGGRADWIWDFAGDQFDAVSQAPGLQALRAETMRIAYLSLDAAGRVAGTEGGADPLTNQTVREAVAAAIDRATLAKQMMPGGARLLDAPCFPTQFGCEQPVATHYAYDPTRARALLAQAGYLDGFDTELVSYTLPQWTGAVRDYLAAVGIRARVSQLPVGEAVARSREGRNPLDLGTWGSYSINDVAAILPAFFAGGPQDYLRDPEVTALVEQGGNTDDPDARRRAYAQAIRLITAKAAYLPLFTYVKTYGFSRLLSFRAFPDDIPRFYLSSWK